MLAEVVQLPLAPQPSWLGAWAHRLMRTPRYITWFSNPLYSLKVRVQINAEIARLKPDLILGHSAGAIQYLPRTTQTNLPTVVDLVDSGALLNSRNLSQAVTSSRSIFERFVLTIDNFLFHYYERWLARRGQVCTYVTQGDCDYARKYSGINNVAVVGNGIDTSYFQPGSWCRTRRLLVFIGVMDYAPNRDAALWLGREIFPRLQQSCPDLTLALVGMSPPAEVSALGDNPAITVTGTVPDVRPYLSEAFCFVCPMRLGAGLKNKILQALAVGIPVISTRAGADGLDMTPDVHYLEANTPDEYQQQITRLMNEPGLGENLIRNGREFVDRGFSWASRAEELVGMFGKRSLAQRSAASNPRVLVLDAGARPALAVIRSLGRAGAEVIAAGESVHDIGLKSKYVAGTFISPSSSEKPTKFVAWLRGVLEQEKPDILLPITTASTEAVLSAAEELRRFSKIPFSAAETIRQANDKWALYLTARDIGIAVPDTELIKNDSPLTSEAEQRLRGFTYPAVLKPRVSDYLSGGRICKWPIIYPKTFSDVQNWFDRRTADMPDYLLQEKLPGDGAGVFMLCQKGEEKLVFAHRRLLEKPPTGGVSVLSESVDPDEQALAASRMLLKKLNWTGVAMVEFKRKADGRMALLEINPRFWGSLQLAIRSGCDFPVDLCNLYLTDFMLPTTTLAKFEKGIRLRWVLGTVDHVLIRLKNDPLAAMRFIFENGLQLFQSGKSTCHDVFDRSDWRPFKQEVINYCRNLIGRK